MIIDDEMVVAIIIDDETVSAVLQSVEQQAVANIVQEARAHGAGEAEIARLTADCVYVLQAGREERFSGVRLWLERELSNAAVN
jgi:hypothetical protein